MNCEFLDIMIYFLSSLPNEISVHIVFETPQQKYVPSIDALLNANTSKYFLFRYGDFHHKVKTVVRPSYNYNGNPHTRKRASLRPPPPPLTMKLRPLNLLRAQFFSQRDQHRISTFHVIPPHWQDTVIWYHSSRKTRTNLCYIVNITGADVLISATMILP